MGQWLVDPEQNSKTATGTEAQLKSGKEFALSNTR